MGTAFCSCSYKSKMETTREGSPWSWLHAGFVLFFLSKRGLFSFVGAEERSRGQLLPCPSSVQCVEKGGEAGELCLCTGSCL